MSVNDHGLEVIRKSAEQVTPGSGADYYLKTSPFGSFTPPATADAVVASYPSSTQEVYVYKVGGVSGIALMTLTVNYVDSTKEQIESVVRS